MIDVLGYFKKSFILLHLILVYDLEFTTPSWSTRPRVYCTLTKFRGGKAPLSPPPLNTPMQMVSS